MADILFSDWDRLIFRLMSKSSEDGLGQLMEALKDTPAEIPDTMHLIIQRHIGFHHDESQSGAGMELPSAFLDATQTQDPDTSILSLVADSQRVHFYKDNLDYFGTHLALSASILTSEALRAETDFLSYVLDEIVDEVELSLIEFRQDIEAGDFDVSAQDMHLFDWCAKRIEQLAGRRNHASG